MDALRTCRSTSTAVRRRFHQRCRRRVLCTLTTAAACVVPGTALLAQDDRIGQIERIAEVIGGGAPVKISTPSPRVEIGRGVTPSWASAQPDQDVFLQDRIRVARYMDVRLKVQRGNQRGWLTFVPEPLTTSGARVFRVDAVAQPAAYVIPLDTTNRGDLSVQIQSGALVVDWRSGRLAVLAAGHTAVIAGTRVAFAMDSTGTAGWMYVDEGTVIFPAQQGLSVGAGQLVRLQVGVPIAPAPVEPAQASALSNATQYHANTLWAQFRPFWQKPQFLLPAFGAIAGATAFAVSQSASDEGPRRGTVVIRIPF